MVASFTASETHSLFLLTLLLLFPSCPCGCSRTVYDCTASPTFSRRWRRGRLIGPDGSVTHCSCDTCIMYDQSLPHTVSSPLAPARPAATTGPNGAACNGEWIVDVRSLYTPTSPDDTTLVFESRFESGNLRTAFQVSMCEYDLTIRPDFNTTQSGSQSRAECGDTRAMRQKAADH